MTRWLYLFSLLGLILSCAKPALAPPRAKPLANATQATPWTHLQWNADADKFHFAILSDRTGGARPGVFAAAIDKLNLLQPELVVSVGDLIEGDTFDRSQLNSEWDEFDRLVAKLEMPFFYVVGNHDIGNPVMAQVWDQRLGPTYYHFVYRDVLFLMLNSEDPSPSHISTAQTDYIAAALAANPTVRWTLLFVHKPLWRYQDDTGWAQVEALLQGRPHTVFAGHYHNYLQDQRNGNDYITLGTTGGVSELRGINYGEFDHLVWLTMTDAGPVLANLMLDGIQDKAIRTPATKALLAPLTLGWAISAKPILAQGQTFSAGHSRLRLDNRAKIPLAIKGRFVPNPKLLVKPEQITLEIPPQQVAWVDLALEAPTPLEVLDLLHLTLEWEAEYTAPDQRHFSVNGKTLVAIEPPLTCQIRTSPLQVDGILDDWDALPHRCRTPVQVRGNPEAWEGPSDSSFRFGVSYDQEYLYIGIEAIDERQILAPYQPPYGQDGIEVRLDARPTNERSFHRGGGEFTKFILVGLSPGKPPGKMVFYRQDKVEPGVKAACIPTATGHNSEIAIPLAYLDQRQNNAWEGFRLNIALSDYDRPEGPQAQLWWRPDWRTPESYAGSGNFSRQQISKPPSH